MPYYNKRYSGYKKRYTKRRRYQKSRSGRYLGYAGTAVSTASKALAVAYGIKKLMNVEFKFHDVQTTTTLNDAPAIIQLTNIPQGDTDQSRDGAQVKLTRLSIKYTIAMNASANASHVRVMLVHDKQTNQAIYAATDLLSDVTVNDSIVSQLNLDNKYRFHVLYNRVHNFSVTGKQLTYQEVNKEIDMRLRFDNSTPSIADLTSSSLSLLFVSNEPTNQPSLTLFARLRYVDN